VKKKIFVIALLAIIIVATVVVFTACNKTTVLQLSSLEDISYDGTKFTWKAVENAGGYDVTINDGETKRITGTSYTYDASQMDNVTIKVAVTSDSDLFLKSNEFTKTFTRLDKISSEDILVTENGAISWPAVTGAVSYQIIINGTSFDTTELYYETQLSGLLRIQVKPIGANDTYSYRSQQKQITRLSVPRNIAYDGNIITWNGVAGATGYELDINGRTYESTQARFEYFAGTQNVSIKIRALGDSNTVFNSAFSNEEIYLQLGTVTNIRVEAGVITWDAVDGATGYKIKINNTELSSVQLHNYYSELSSGVTYKISILPYTSAYKHFASWSNEMDVYLLHTPEIKWDPAVDLSDGVARTVITWDGINQAAGYSVKVQHSDGRPDEIFDYSESQRSFAYAFSDVGDYKISVKSNASPAQNGIYESLYCNEILVSRLAAPTPYSSNFVSSYTEDVTKGFVVTFNKVAGATGYTVYKDGIKLGAESATVLNNQISVRNVVNSTTVEVQEFNYAIKSEGNITNQHGNTVVKLGSNTALTIPISVLAMPRNVTFSGFVMSWDSIEQSTGYVVNYGGIPDNCVETNFELSKLNPGNYEMRVAARGNGRNVLSSNYTSVKNVVRLAAPLDVHISVEESGEGMLVYEPVAYATSYDVTIDNSTEPIPASSYSNMYQYITTLGSVIHMTSVANYETGGVYYVTSPSTSTSKITRLATPLTTGMSFTNSQFIWSAPSNISTAVYTPTYQVYNGTNVAYNGEQNGCTMNISYLDGGEEYVFKVKAVGDGYNYINSEISEAVSIYKLATPNVRVENNKYIWDSVVSANNYYVEIEGVRHSDVEHVSGQEYYYKPTFSQIGTFTVKIVATGDNGITSVDSKPYIIQQTTKQLATPQFTYGYSNETYDPEGEIYIDVTSSTNNVLRFLYQIAGVTLYNVNTHQSHNPNGVGTYTLGVRAEGGVIDEVGVYWVTSQLAGGDTVSITLISSPNKDSIQINQDGRISWGICTGAIKYEYQISIDGGEFTAIEATTKTYYDLSNWGKIGSVKIRVRGLGDGKNSITSQWQEKTLYNS